VTDEAEDDSDSDEGVTEPDACPYELLATPTVGRALAERLPEAVAGAAYEFITGPLLFAPHRVGSACSLHWRTV
jgi:hypothetical protein